jgi:type I restriction enzyme S subunit
MSRIAELIAELCPRGVDFAPLGELVRIRNGKDYKALGIGEIPVYGTGGVMLYVDESAHPGPSVLIPRKGSLSKLYYVDKPFWTVDTLFYTEIGDRLVPKFLFYHLSTQRLEELNRAGGVPSLTQSVLNLLLVPVPPLEVQREIVRILDQFTQLEAELNAELMARRRQRLAFTRLLPGAAHNEDQSSNVKHIRLGEVASQYVEPVRVQDDTTYRSLGVKWYGEGVLVREPKLGSAIKGTVLYAVKPGYLVYNRMFVTEGSFAIVPPELANGVVSNEFPVYELDRSRILPEWLLLYLQDEYTLKRIAAEVTGVERGSTKSRMRWKEGQFEAFQIALPSISVQREMVRVVGTVAALESALRDEMTARRKQFEYYRNKLLTFEEAVT